jgi:HK97 family phage prohead protease
MIFERSQQYAEVFSHGAFSGCEKNPGRCRVNLHHQRERVVGKALSLDPWDERGLTGTLRLARTRDADQALALAEDGILRRLGRLPGPLPGGETWETRGRRRISRAELDHIGLTPDPAYETAKVLAVRGRRPSETPNLDRARALLAR